MGDRGKVSWAAEVLNLGKSATLREIDEAYRREVKEWHPDNCDADKAECEERTKEIVEAYDVLREYCESYRFSLREEDLQETTPGDDEWWTERFGDDPIWGT